jgi:hypothetical protein
MPETLDKLSSTHQRVPGNRGRWPQPVADWIPLGAEYNGMLPVTAILPLQACSLMHDWRVGDTSGTAFELYGYPREAQWNGR